MNLADDCFVDQKGILLTLAYLLLLCIFLGYSLITFWPPPAAPVISSLKLVEGSKPQTLIISGTGFAKGATVSFNDLPGRVTRDDSTSLTVEVPEKLTGPATVTVANPGPSASSPQQFTFTPAPAPSTNPPGSTGAASNNPGTTPTPPASGQPAGTASPKPKPGTPPATNQKAPAPGQNVGAAPSSTTPTGGTAGSTPATSATASETAGVSKVSYFGRQLAINENVRILIVVMIVGALGSLIHVFRSFFWYVGNRNLKNSWLLMYFLLPFTGAGLAVLFYLIIRGGIPQAPTNPSPTALDGYAAIAALVGMFSQEALQKLKQIAGAFFTPAEQGKDQAVEKLTISALNPTQGPAAGGQVVTITGSGFSKGNQVSFGGVAATAVTVASGTRVTATTPAHAAGPVDVEVTNSAGIKSTLPASFTYQ